MFTKIVSANAFAKMRLQYIYKLLYIHFVEYSLTIYKIKINKNLHKFSMIFLIIYYKQILKDSDVNLLIKNFAKSKSTSKSKYKKKL